MTKTIVIIPSRFHSVRLPQKPLADILGQSLVERVYRQCRKAEGIDAVYVATDHQAIQSEVERFGGSVIQTDPDCPSGTDRVAQAAFSLGVEDVIIINVQGDEPLIAPEVITALRDAMLQDPNLPMATPISRLRDADGLTNPNVVKVVRSNDGDALYFSRQSIPFIRDKRSDDMSGWLDAFPYYKHIGVYAYRLATLRLFVSLPESPLELAERLEQLRMLQAGVRIRCVEVEYDSVAVDTAEDVTTVIGILQEREQSGIRDFVQ